MLARAEASEAQSCPMTYGGGPVISDANVIIVYWTSAFDSVATSYPKGLFEVLVNSAYVDWLQEYDPASQTPPGTNQTICRGSLEGNTPEITPTVNTTTTVDDTDIGNELLAQIAAGNIQPPYLDASGAHYNTVYAVYFPPGYTIT